MVYDLMRNSKLTPKEYFEIISGFLIKEENGEKGTENVGEIMGTG